MPHTLRASWDEIEVEKYQDEEGHVLVDHGILVNHDLVIFWTSVAQEGARGDRSPNGRT